MAKQPKSSGSRQDGGKAEERRDRLAAALRDNLKKRKDQARARARPAAESTADTTKS
jgi:hypothetical protein